MVVDTARELEKEGGTESVDRYLDELLSEASSDMDTERFFEFNQMKHGASFGSLSRLMGLFS
jgi:hypothetical protein